MNLQTVRKRLARLAKKHGTRGLGRLWSVDPAYISHVISGDKDPGKQILDAMGLDAITSYRTKVVDGSGNE